MTSRWGPKKQEILRKILGQYQDYFHKLIALSFFKINIGSNSWIMYVSQLLSKENWSKSPYPDERVYKAGNFLQILGFFFHFLPQLYSDLSRWTNFILQILYQRFGLNVQTPMHESTMQEIFCEILIFFFIFLLRITLTTVFYKYISLICST
jgi:hypothetical protein